MKLYQVNEEIARLTDMLGMDPETGEVVDNADEIIKRIRELGIHREAMLEFLAKQAQNLRAETEAFKAEEQRLRARRQAVENRRARLLELLDRECGGQTTKLGVLTLCHTRSKSLDVSDAAQAAEWLKSNGYAELYHISAPELDKTAVKRLVLSGADVPGCAVVESTSCYLK